MSQARIAQGKLAFSIGSWLVHAVMLVVLLALFAQRMSLYPARAWPQVAARMIRIPTLERYLARQIYAAVGFVLLGFLALFAFFDLIARTARPRQRQLPAAPDLHRGGAVDAGRTPTSWCRSRC